MKILVLANSSMGLYKFRKELLQELIRLNSDIYISLPYDKYVPILEKLGCNYIETNIDRRGTNPITDLILIRFYKKTIKDINPDIVLTYTIKPNIYGGIACQVTNTPYIANVTGLGTFLESEGLMRKIALALYRVGMKKASCVFFQNKSNRNFFIDKKIVTNRTKLIPGSGVNLEEHCVENYPDNDNYITFIFVGRIMKAKGIDELLEAAQRIKVVYPNIHFDIVGSVEEDYNARLLILEKQGIIKYHGHQDDIHTFIKQAHATILPSYHEGTSNVLLESAATGRPVLASKVPGCIETFDDGISGLGFEAKNVKSLVDTIVTFIELPYDQKRRMGIAGRKKIEQEYDRRIVINAYIEEINKFERPEK